MSLFTLEHSPAAGRVDFVLYAAAVIALAGFLLIAGPADRRMEIVAFSLLGLGSWSALEYALHRFVLHGLQPFQRWHAEHHRRPAALIWAPTVLSAGLIATLVFLPVWLLADVWLAAALTLGVLAGYLAYTLTHHALHHGRADQPWLSQRKQWHGRHHHGGDYPGHYGVTSGFWDHVFDTARSGPPRDRY